MCFKYSILFIFSKNKNDKENQDNAVPKYKRDLVHKLKILKQEFTSLQPQGGHCRLEVSREEIFEVCSFFYRAPLGIKFYKKCRKYNFHVALLRIIDTSIICWFPSDFAWTVDHGKKLSYIV